MISAQSLDPHQRPPEHIRSNYKRYQKANPGDLEQDEDIVDFRRGLTDAQKERVRVTDQILPDELNAIFHAFDEAASTPCVTSPVLVYEHLDLPGLKIIPYLLPPETQRTLLCRLLHRDLSRPEHLTNIHTHYTIGYPQSSAGSRQSFFSFSPKHPSPTTTPLDPAVHRPLSVAQLLNRKLRWMTLGGQYDWTAKCYPASPPPPFPHDIKTMLEGVFADTKAEAAIVNLYSPGDTLSVHRDVAEECSKGLSSLSLGCDAIFVVGKSNEDETFGSDCSHEKGAVTVRLSSGSAVYMSGEARFAWHGVPQVVAGTCPEYLGDWPAGSGNEKEEFEDWRGWMSGKRVNLNVRQMWD